MAVIRLLRFRAFSTIFYYRRYACFLLLFVI